MFKGVLKTTWGNLEEIYLVYVFYSGAYGSSYLLVVVAVVASVSVTSPSATFSLVADTRLTRFALGFVTSVNPMLFD